MPHLLYFTIQIMRNNGICQDEYLGLVSNDTWLRSKWPIKDTYQGYGSDRL